MQKTGAGAGCQGDAPLPASDLGRYTDWARAFMIVNHESARRSEVQMLWYDYRL